MEQGLTAQQLTGLVEQVYADEMALVSGLSETDRNAAGTVTNWSAKDTLAHIVHWDERLARRLSAVCAGNTVGIEPRSPDEDDDTANARVFAENAAIIWDALLARLQKVKDDLVTEISQLDPQVLAAPTPWPDDEQRPLWREILGTGYLHPEIHLGELYSRRGNIRQMRLVGETAYGRLLDLDPPDEVRGLALYNLACLHALGGENERAIELLEQALPLYPRLYEWSRKDPDLASLHDDPQFQALYQK